MKRFKPALIALKRRIGLSKDTLTSSAAAPPNENVKPRKPPPPPTPIQLPVGPSEQALGRSHQTAQETSQLFSSIHKTGPRVQHLQALGICSVREISLEELLPTEHLPTALWQHNPATSGGSNVFPAPLPTVARLSNGFLVPGHEVWYKSAKELLYDNDAAFRSIERKPPLPGESMIRVAMFRKFWDNLLQMALYWDTSLDKYMNEPELEKENLNKENTLENTYSPVSTNTSKHTYSPVGANTSGNAYSPVRTIGQDDWKSDNGKSKECYTGRRIGSGRDMPFRFRDETVFAFVESIAMAFLCTAEIPRVEPRVKLQNILMPLPLSGVVYRRPNDREQARRGILEGPLVAIQCSNQTIFRRPGEAEGEGQGELANLLREVGLMICMAQKRARDGLTEPDPKKGEWWATTPRWGGGSGGEVENPQNNVGDDPDGTGRERKRSKRTNAVESWKNLQPPSSGWEKGVVHLQIGKAKSSEYDNVRVSLFSSSLSLSPNNHLNPLLDLPHLRRHAPHLHPPPPSPQGLHPASELPLLAPNIYPRHAPLASSGTATVTMVRSFPRPGSLSGHARHLGRHGVSDA